MPSVVGTMTKGAVFDGVVNATDVGAFNSMDEKTVLLGDDLLVLSDSATSYTRKKIKLSSLGGNVIEKSITLESPTDAGDITIFFTNRAITITEMRAVLSLGTTTPSITWTIRHHASDRSNAGAEVVTGGTTTTSITTGSDVTAFDDATIPADSYVWLETTAQSGVTPELHITLIAKID